jgi:transcriptional regulator with XRE-family HTH domain
MDTDPGGNLPAEHLTIDQLVARNMRRWRLAAGLTQDELGARLGWTGLRAAANVSAAERSADPARDARRFDAQTLTELSLALSVPLVAFFFPPDDDGQRARYMFTAAGRDYDMSDLMALAVMTDSPDDQPVMQAYRQAFTALAGRYLDDEWQLEVGAWLRPIEEKELRAERADRLLDAAQQLRRDRDALGRAAAELELLAAAIDPKEEPR